MPVFFVALLFGLVILMAIWPTPGFQDFLRAYSINEMARRSQKRLNERKKKALDRYHKNRP